MINEFKYILTILTTFLFVFFSAFLIIQRRTKVLRNRILAAFLIANALFLIPILAYRFGFNHHPAYPYLFYTGISFYFLFGPLLFFYTQSLCYQSFALRKKDFLHLLLFLAIAAYFIIHYQMRKMGFSGLQPNPIPIITIADKLVYDVSLHISMLIYLVASIHTLRQYQTELKHHYSSIEKINLSWLLFILFGFMLMWVVDALKSILSYLDHSHPEIYAIFSLISFVIYLIFATMIIYFGLKDPRIIAGLETRLKYSRSRLTSSEREYYQKKLLDYMATEKPFLIPALTIGELAQKLSIPQKILSQIINESFRQNFMDFINSFRIETAVAILRDPAQTRKTILEILYEVGFNSKSVFNDAFKKHTRMTPSAYKRQHQQHEILK